MHLFLPAEMPVLKLPLLAFFWFHRPVGATLCTDYRQIWRGRGGRHILLTAKIENFRGSFGELRPKKPEKRLNNLENARKISIFRPVSTNP